MSTEILQEPLTYLLRESQFGLAAEVEDAATTIDRLRARVEALEGALRWYAEKAEAVARYMEAKPPKDHATMAVVTELQLDRGARARAALTEGADAT